MSAPPRRAAVDLSKADTSDITHRLYVKVVPAGDPDTKSNAITLRLLQFVKSRMPAMKQMGLTVHVDKITSIQLKNTRLTDAMKKRGILRLPALTTTSNIYLGVQEIEDVYEKNIRAFQAHVNRGERPVEGAADDDDYSEFYRKEMTFARAVEDAQHDDDDIGNDNTSSMMDTYRDRCKQREQSTKPPGAGGVRTHAGVTFAAGTAGERRQGGPAPASRADNVGAPARPSRPPRDISDDAEIEDTIDRLAREIDEGTMTQAFSGGGGDSLDDDEGGGGGNSAQDTYMERAFWANQQESL
jgi:hypothetical protein